MNKYMKTAILEAKTAYSEGNVPVGAVIVKNDEIISKAHNTKNSTNVSINHAEILAIKDACEKLNTWHLEDCSIYVTLSPCDMCLAAIAESRISKVYYLLDSNYADNLLKKIYDINLVKLNDSEQYSMLISNFFENMRKK